MTGTAGVNIWMWTPAIRRVLRGGGDSRRVLRWQAGPCGFLGFPEWRAGEALVLLAAPSCGL